MIGRLWKHLSCLVEVYLSLMWAIFSLIAFIRGDSNLGFVCLILSLLFTIIHKLNTLLSRTNKEVVDE